MSEAQERSGELSARLAERPAREDAASQLKLSSAVRPLELRPEEAAATAVGMLVLERAAAASGSRFPLRTLRDLRIRLTEPMTSRDVMTLEVEAYDTLKWLIGQSQGDSGLEGHESVPGGDRAAGDLIDYDPDMAVIDLLRRAIIEEFDVDVQYYTQSRGELTRRRISPHHIQAETYLHAYCHRRLDERVFRISRIAEIAPVDGHPMRGPAPKPPRAQTELDL